MSDSPSANDTKETKRESLIDPKAYIGFRTIQISCPSDVLDQQHDASKQVVTKSMRPVTLMIKQNYDFGLGGGVWDSALVLVKYLTRAAAFTPEHFRGKRVLELGSGTGVCGLSLAFLGAKVTLTDVASHLPLIDDNISFNVNESNGTNHLRKNIVVTDYSWGTDPEKNRGTDPEKNTGTDPASAKRTEIAAPSNVADGVSAAAKKSDKKKRKKKKRKQQHQRKDEKNSSSAPSSTTADASTSIPAASAALGLDNLASAIGIDRAESSSPPTAVSRKQPSAPTLAAPARPHRPPLNAPYDVIIGSDLVYDNTQDYSKLCKSFFLLSNSTTEIYLAYEKRTRKEIAFFQELANKFTFSKIPNAELDEEFQSDDIGVFKIRRK